jgi:hypothetical protein
MGVHTTMTMNRGSVPTITTPFAVMVVTLSQQEAAYYGGAAPYFRYQIIVKAPNTFKFGDFEQGDLLIDTDMNDLDPKTRTNKHYRVISDPKFYFDTHIECIADRMRGT